MSFYDRHVLPHLIDCACGMGEVMKARSAVVPRASGRVLEIGIGTGLNLSLYDPKRVTGIFGVDPSAEMERKARTRADRIDIPVEMVPMVIESIHAESASFDSVVCTFTLCTIPDPASALREMARVLRPGGALYFCEHGLAPDSSVQRWQHRLTPFWKPFAGGCHLDRNIPQLVEAGGFAIDELESDYLSGPRPMTYVYRGVARPEAAAMPGR